MFYVGEFRANLVVYHFCLVLSYKKWTLGILNKFLRMKYHSFGQTIETNVVENVEMSLIGTWITTENVEKVFLNCPYCPLKGIGLNVLNSKYYYIFDYRKSEFIRFCFIKQTVVIACARLTLSAIVLIQDVIYLTQFI